jgi:hypothetical protein
LFPGTKPASSQQFLRNSQLNCEKVDRDIIVYFIITYLFYELLLVQKAQLGEIGGSGGRYQGGEGGRWDQGRGSALGGGGWNQGRGRQELRRTRGGSSGQKASELRHRTPKMEVTGIILAKDFVSCRVTVAGFLLGYRFLNP